jgi:GTP cyclohydrolase IA
MTDIRSQTVGDLESIVGSPGSTAESYASRLLSLATGLDLDSPHGRDTPARYVRMLKELTTPEEFNFTMFANDDGSDEMITIRDVPFVSVCNHHVIPFIGHAYIAYVPRDVIAGLSKFARTVKYFAKSLQTQERLTKQVADFLEEKLQPRGLAVVMDAEHMCMTIRGVQSPGTLTRTAAMRGVFSDHTRTAKAEFMATINGGIPR